ncbi:MAG: tetratricopeptide repeat protein, partial [Spirochaetaceae bacterium]|nr:tetratricopeptide repeat protein [Spirochaetaceae bacterium]
SNLLEDAVWFFRALGYSSLAESTLLQSIDFNPEDGRLWNQLGVHLMETGWDENSNTTDPGAIDSAVHAYRRAVGLLPENPVILGNLGDALRQSGKLAEAADFLEKAVEGGSSSSEDAFALNSLARLEDERSYSVEGSESSAADWERSGDHYHQAAVNSLENADFHRDYAWWLYRERRLEESLASYRRAGNIDLSDESFPYGEYTCYMELGDERAASEALNRALVIKPDDPLMLADKADLLGITGKVEVAERIYHELLSEAGSPAWIWERLAEFRGVRAVEAEPSNTVPMIFLDDFEQFDFEMFVSGSHSSDRDRWRHLTLDAWGKALNIEPENHYYKIQFAAALMDTGQFEKAGEILKRELGNANSLNRLGRLELYKARKLGDEKLLSVSKGHLIAAVKAIPEVSSFHADLGCWYYLESRWKKALEEFRQAADREPECSEYAANAGICAYASGNFNEGVAYLKRALSMGGSIAEWLNVLGLSLLAVGSQHQALEAFRSACLADPFSDVFPANLAMAHNSLHIPAGPLQ